MAHAGDGTQSILQQTAQQSQQCGQHSEQWVGRESLRNRRESTGVDTLTGNFHALLQHVGNTLNLSHLQPGSRFTTYTAEVGFQSLKALIYTADVWFQSLKSVKYT
jgi:hypothetical protein